MSPGSQRSTYALHAANNMQGPAWPHGPSGPGPCGIICTHSGRIVLCTSSNAYGFGYNDVSGSGCYSTVLNGEVVFTAVALARIEIWTATNGYGFGYNEVSASSWCGTTLNAEPLRHVVGGSRIVLYNATNGYGFGLNDTSGSGWYGTTFTAPPVGSQSTR
ncbi:MAG: hypothetical protein IPG69_11360 [Flavobacteriales bacterium]|nr:hypothetical protein [Flavobacteriales bacterium]